MKEVIMKKNCIVENSEVEYKGRKEVSQKKRK